MFELGVCVFSVETIIEEILVVVLGCLCLELMDIEFRMSFFDKLDGGYE